MPASAPRSTIVPQNALPPTSTRRRSTRGPRITAGSSWIGNSKFMRASSHVEPDMDVAGAARVLVSRQRLALGAALRAAHAHPASAGSARRRPPRAACGTRRSSARGSASCRPCFISSIAPLSLAMFSGRETLLSWKMRGCFGFQSIWLNLWLKAPEASSTARRPLRRIASPIASPDVRKCGQSQFWHELTRDHRHVAQFEPQLLDEVDRRVLAAELGMADRAVVAAALARDGLDLVRQLRDGRGSRTARHAGTTASRRRCSCRGSARRRPPGGSRW